MGMSPQPEAAAASNRLAEASRRRARREFARNALPSLAWMPASAGMTRVASSLPNRIVILAQAGIHASFRSITTSRGMRRPTPSPRLRGEGIVEARDAA